MKKKVLVVGRINGAYRTQNLIHILTDYNPDNDFEISLCNPGIYSRNTNSICFREKVFRKIMYYISIIFNTIDIFIKNIFCDVVYIAAMNHFWFRICYYYKFIFRKPVVVDMYISGYQTASDRGYLNKKNKSKIIKLDKMMIEKADKLIYPVRKELIHVAGLIGAKINWNKVDIVPIVVDEKKIANPKDSDVFRICWWGTWIPLHGLENIIKSIKILKESRVNNIRLDLFGVKNAQMKKYIDLITDFDLHDCVFVSTDKNFTNGSLEDHLSKNCDLALGHFGDTDKAKWVFTNKVVDALAMKLPVLTLDNNVLNEFLGQDDVFSSSSDPEEIAKKIIYIINNKEEVNWKVENAYNKYIQFFSKKAYKEKVLGLLSSL